MARSSIRSSARRQKAADVEIANAVVDLSHHNGDVDLELAKGAGIIGDHP